MANQYYLKNIRTLLTEGFTPEELRRLCHDESDFRSVYNKLAEETGKATIIDWLLEYANQKLQMETLLTWAQEHNPAMYETYKPYYDVTTSPTTSNEIYGKSQSDPTIEIPAIEPVVRPSQLSSRWPRWIVLLGVGDWFKPKLKPKSPLALVINVQGWVEVRRKASDRVIPAAFGMHLFFEDAVITYESSAADLMCQNGFLFHLDRQSTLVVRCGETDDRPPLSRLPANLSQRLTSPSEVPTVMTQAELASAEQVINQLRLGPRARRFLRAKLYEQGGLIGEAILELEELASQRRE
ncbi:MAG: hypothetical protein HYR94_03110, partial [Chloroflexi bacterium]|nr:hypothetical protein [Chloroflexota bacterium]